MIFRVDGREHEGETAFAGVEALKRDAPGAGELAGVPPRKRRAHPF